MDEYASYLHEQVHDPSSALDASGRALLLERAGACLSFQPRFVRVELIGTPDDVAGAELPPMDSNGRADPYVVLHLRSAAGDFYPKKGVYSRTAYRSTRPWYVRHCLMRHSPNMALA